MIKSMIKSTTKSITKSTIKSMSRSTTNSMTKFNKFFTPNKMLLMFPLIVMLLFFLNSLLELSSIYRYKEKI